MEVPASNGFESLLGHAHFVRQLASGLVHDPASQEDLVQETWLAALETPPRKREGMRSWFRVVTRNFAHRRWRGDQRRALREQRAARPEVLPAAAELVAREAVLRQVMEAVLALSEDHRAVILYRFYEDLPPRAIAERLEIPVATVNSRLQRALRALRTRLDGAAGSRKAWCAPLVSLVGTRVLRPPGALAGRALAAKLTAAGAVAATVLALTLPESPPPSIELDSSPSAPLSAATELSTRPEPIVPRRSPARGRIVRNVPGLVSVEGRILDGRRFPLAGLEVLLHRPGHSPLRTRSDGEGRYRFRLRLGHEAFPCEIGLQARTGSGEVAFMSRRLLEPRRHELEEMVLEESGALELTLRDGGRPASGATIRLRLVDHRPFRFTTRSLSTVYLGERTADEQGRLRWDSLPRGPVAITVAGRQRGGGQATTIIDAASTRKLDLVLEARPATPLRLLSRESGRAVAGERVELFRRESGRLIPVDVATLRSDEDGRVRLPGLDPEREYAVATPVQRLADPNAATPLVIGRGEQQVTVPGHRSLSWPLSADGASFEGTLPVSFQGDDGVALGRRQGIVEAGLLRVERVPEDAREGLAWSPESNLLGRLFVHARNEEPDPVELVEGITAKLRLVSTTGRPLPGLVLELEDGDEDFRRRREVVSDDSGEVLLAGVMPGSIQIAARVRTPLATQRIRLGNVDLGGSEPVILRLPEATWVEAEFLVNGQPRLPANLSLMLGRGHRGPPREDPVRGTLSFPVHPFDAAVPDFSLAVVADGMDGTIRKIAFDPGGVQRLRFDLQAQPAVEVEVLPPEDGHYSAARMDWSRKRWSLMPPACLRKIGRDRYSLGSLADGDFLVIDRESGASTPPFRVLSGERPERVVLDLRASGWIDGALELPPGATIRGALVRIVPKLAKPNPNGRGESRPDSAEEAQLARFRELIRNYGSNETLWNWSGTWRPVDARGRFRVRVPGDRPVRLEFHHPRYRARHPIVVHEPGRSVLVPLEPKRRALLPLVVPHGERLEPEVARQAVLKLHAITTDARPAPLQRLRPWIDGSELSFPYRGETRVNFLLDLPGWEPLLRRDVVLGGGITRLAAHELSRGAQLLIRLRSKSWGPTPELRARVTALQAPHHERFGVCENGEIRVRGLGPGRFRIRLDYSGTSLGPALPQRIVEVKRNQQLELSYELKRSR